MGEKTKTVTDYSFFFADHRPQASMPFAAQAVRFDPSEGDVKHDLSDGSLMFTQGNGRTITIPRNWLWAEEEQRILKVKE